MRKIILLLLIAFISCQSEKPKQFSEKALQEVLISLDNSKVTFKDILEQHSGKKILLNVWASWCKDCISGFPDSKKIQKEFPNVVYVFLSVDQRKSSWRRAIEKYNLIGDHYNLSKGMNSGELVDFINLSWIPRYIVVDENGGIQLFKATKASDKRIIKALERSL